MMKLAFLLTFGISLILADRGLNEIHQQFVPYQNSDKRTEDILATTVQLILYVPDVDAGPNSHTPLRGIGTMTELGGRRVIITHNHWNEALQEMAFMQFRSSANSLIMEMDSTMFRSLITFQDAGTLILNLPQSWPANYHPAQVATLGDLASVRPSATVQVAYRASHNREQLAVIQAQVVAVLDEYAGSPALILQSLDGVPILPGDSGGGIWSNGKLIGNMWARVLDSETQAQTDLSIAAQQPDEQRIALYQDSGDVIHQMKQALGGS